MSSSVTLFSDSKRLSSNDKPVIFIGPFGISSNVNLNCATSSPAIYNDNSEHSYNKLQDVMCQNGLTGYSRPNLEYNNNIVNKL